MTYSWVPDWDSGNDENAYHATAWPSEHFHASASSEIDIRFRDEEKVLGLTGHLLEPVEEVGLVFHVPPNAKVFGFAFLAALYYTQQIWRSWEATAQLGQRKTYRNTEESMWDAYWQIVLFGEHGFRHEEKERVRAEFDAFFAAHRKPYLFAERLRLYWTKRLWVIYSVMIMILTGLGVFGKFQRGAGLAFTTRSSQTGWRRMIRTQSGYIGLAVHAAQVGDHVSLFRGAHMPFLVRSSSNGLRLVGDCYIHGIMHGERWQPDTCETLWLH
jgi:hypothetical protein